MGNVLRHPAQHALPFKCRQPSRRAESLDCSRDGRIGVLAPSLKNAADNTAIVGCSYLDLFAFLDPFAIEEERMSSDGSCSHLCHGEVLAPPQKQNKDYRLFARSKA